MSEEEGQPDWLRNDSKAGGGVSTSASSNENFSMPLPSNKSSSSPLLQKLQSAAATLSLLLTLVSIIIVSLLANAWGGVAWSEGNAKQVFNWHPILMICAYAFMNVGVLIFRLSGTSSYQQQTRNEQLRQLEQSTAVFGEETNSKRGFAKLTHSTIWACTFLFGVIGILAVFKSHNDPVSGYIANLYSLHSWVGIFVLTLYCVQFLYGILAFGGLLSTRGRFNHPIMMEIHKFTGTYLHILVTATILMGIQEKEVFFGCSYEVQEADVVPFKNLGMIPGACKLSHGLGVIVLAIGLLTSFSLTRLPVF